MRPDRLRDVSAPGAPFTFVLARREHSNPSDPGLEKRAFAIVEQLVRDELHDRQP